MKITLAQVKASSIPQATGIPACDARFVDLVNEAQQLLVMGPEKWWNLNYKYRISVTDGLMTWPKEIASIESIALCGSGIPIRSEWFEFLETGYGLRDKDAYCSTAYENEKWDAQLFDRGMSPLFSDIVSTGNPKRILMITELDEDGDVRLFGLDTDGNPFRTVDERAGTCCDGQIMPMEGASGAGVFFPTYASSITGVVKPATCGTVWLYEYDSVLHTQRLIATYRSNETVPSYRRSFIGGLCQQGDCVVTVLAKREFEPVVCDGDILLIGSIPALKEMMVAIRKRDQDVFDSATFHEAKARDILDREAQHYLGSATQAPIQIFGETYGGGYMEPVY